MASEFAVLQRQQPRLRPGDLDRLRDAQQRSRQPSIPASPRAASLKAVSGTFCEDGHHSLRQLIAVGRRLQQLQEFTSSRPRPRSLSQRLHADDARLTSTPQFANYPLEEATLASSNPRSRLRAREYRLYRAEASAT